LHEYQGFFSSGASIPIHSLVSYLRGIHAIFAQYAQCLTLWDYHHEIPVRAFFGLDESAKLMVEMDEISSVAGKRGNLS